MSYTYDEGVVAAIKIADNKANTRSLIIFIIIIIVVVIISIGVYLLYRLNRTKANANNVALERTKCIADAECPSGAPKCNVSLGKCVQCTDDTTCISPTPKCKVSTNSCVDCLTDGDCGAGLVCTNNLCLEP